MKAWNRHRSGRLFASLLALLLVCCGNLAAATKPDEGLPFRRVFVPADRTDVWPTHGEAYVPIDPVQLRSLLEQAQASAESVHSSAPYAAESVCYARYDGIRLIDGQGCIVVFDAAQPFQFFDWPVAGISLRDPRWKDRPDAPVKLGAWSRDGILRTGLQVEHPGALLFSFQASAATKTDDAAQFEIGLPRALRRKFYLDLPDHFTLHVGDGSVQQLTSGIEPVAEASEPLIQLPSPGVNYRRWCSTSGPGSAMQLRIEHPEPPTAVSSDAPAYREHLTYYLHPQGMDLEAVFDLVNARKLPVETTIELDASLKLVDVQWQGTAIPWQKLPSNSAGTDRYRLALPAALDDRSLQLRIRAWGDLPLDTLRRLPQLSAADLFWSEGQLDLQLSDELQLVDLRTGGLSPILAPEGEWTPSPGRWPFVKHRQFATAEIAVSEADPSVHASVGASLELSNASTKAVVRMQLRADGKLLPPYIDADVLNGWEIDSVESSSAAGPTDWYVDPSDEGRGLRVVLPESPAADNPCELVIEAHRQKSLAEGDFTLAELVAVDWRNFEPQRRIMSITVIEPLALQMEGNVGQLTFDELRETDAELLQNSEVAALVLLDETDLNARLKLTPEPPVFSAAVDIAVHVEPKIVRQESTIHIEALRSPLSKVRVMLSSAPTGEVRWSDPQTGLRLPSARVETVERSSKHDIWEVQLSQGDAGGQSLQVSCTGNWGDEFPVSLLALPDASSQSAQVAITGLLSADSEWTTAGLVQQTVAVDTSQTAPRASFRYDPARLSSDSSSSQLVLRPHSNSTPPRRGVIDHVQLHSRFVSDVESIHRADFHLRGAGPIRCRLPQDARWIGLAWNGRPIHTAQRSGELLLEIEPAPPGAAPSVLHIEFALPGTPLRDGQTLSASLPDLGLPLATGVWSLELPATYQIATTRYLQSIDPEWHDRLLAPWRQWSHHRLISAAETSATHAGWREWEIEFSGFPPQNLGITRLSRRYALAYGIGLSAACLTAWQLIRRPALLAILAAIAAIAALWMPPTSSMFATTIWVGMWAGVAWRALLIAYSWRSKASEEPASSLPFAPARTALFWTFTLGLLPHSSAAEQPAPPMPIDVGVNGKVAQILVPIDSQGVPVGDKHFVPLAFWEDLLKRAHRSQEAQGGESVVLKGLYVGELRQLATGSDAIASHWNLTWEVVTNRQNASVRLPLIQSEGLWQPQALVDGIPAPLHWNSDGRGCRVPIAQPGAHRVIVRVEPAIQVDSSHFRLRLGLPALLEAQCQLTYPTALPGLELPSNATPSTVDSQRAKVIFPLPNNESIDLKWAVRSPDTTNTPAWEVEQAELLTVTPDGAHLNVRLELRGLGSPPASVDVDVDSYLEPIDSADIPAEEYSVRDGRRILSIPVATDSKATEAPRTFAELRFALPRRQVLGSYRYPEVRVVGLLTRSRIIALAIDNRLVQEMVQNPVGDTLDPDQIAELWEDSPIAPSAAYRIPREQANWTFAVNPRLTSTPPEESLLVACNVDDFVVQYQGLFAPGGAPILLQSLQVPPELREVRVTLASAAAPRGEPLQTARPLPNRVVVFFPRPLKDGFRLMLDGKIDALTSEFHPLPNITARPGENLSQRVQIYRRPECQVEVNGLETKNSSVDFTLASPWRAETYPVAAYSERLDKIASLRLRMRENRPRLAAQSVTHFDPAVGVTFVSRIRALEGWLDQVDLEVPADWIGPLDVTPTAQVVEQGGSSPGRRRVRLRLANSVAPLGELVLRFNGSIAATQDGTLQVPAITLRGPNPNEQWIAVKSDILPTKDVWTLEGVVFAALPSSLQPDVNQANLHVFQVQGDRDNNFIMRYSPKAAQHPFAALSLADVRVREDHNGANVALTQFLMPPITSSNLEIEWPEGHDPLGVFVENQLVSPTTIDERRWSLPLGPTDLPIVLTAISRSPSSGASAKTRYERPQIWQQGLELPIPVTLWAIDSLRSFALTLNTKTDTSTVAELSTLRLARMIQLVNSAEPTSAELPSVERAAWHGVWAGRIRAESAALAAAELQSSTTENQAIVETEGQQTRRQLISQVNQLLARMTEHQAMPGTPAEQPAPILVPRAPIEAIDLNPQSTHYFTTTGEHLDLETSAVSDTSNRELTKIIGTFIIVALLGAILRWAPHWDVAEAAARHPRWLVAGIGIIWWSCLTPSPIGAALFLAAVLSWAAEWWARRPGFRPRA